MELPRTQMVSLRIMAIWDSRKQKRFTPCQNIMHQLADVIFFAGLVSGPLPWFESFASEVKSQTGTPKRFLSVYHPDGVGLPLKSDPAWKDWSWFPRGGEHDFELTKVLDVLEPLRMKLQFIQDFRIQL